MSVHLPKGLLSRFARTGRTVEVQTVDEPTVYAVGEEGAGAYEADVAIDAGENTVPDESDLQFVVVGNLVMVLGGVGFDGANTTLEFQLPDELWPYVGSASYVSLAAFADDGGVRKAARLNIGEEGDCYVAMLDGSAFANGDAVILGGTYLLASAVS